jgi:hypothetical protein
MKYITFHIFYFSVCGKKVKTQRKIIRVATVDV